MTPLTALTTRRLVPFLVFLPWVCPAIVAADLDGLWLVENGKAKVEMRRFHNDSRLWTDGSIYDPETGKTYRCKLRRHGDDRLKLRGYRGVSLFGRTTEWTRVSD